MIIFDKKKKTYIINFHVYVSMPAKPYIRPFTVWSLCNPLNVSKWSCFMFIHVHHKLKMRFYCFSIAETRETKDITEKSDMYGFGLILIELLTGKGPADAEFGGHESIVEWARYCYSDCHLDMWIDPMISGNASINQNELIETMNLALQCTATEPTARPCANEVSKTLESALRKSSCVLGLKFSSLF